FVTPGDRPENYVYQARMEGQAGTGPSFVEDSSADEGQIFWVVAEGEPTPGQVYSGKLSAKPGQLSTCTCPDKHESCYCHFIKKLGEVDVES
ncbi:MAG: hypothetical protein Q9Q40_15515, partial [Acidobacteriota bacterium]|nr:hypothetical protein [Acidobacteriota bacterium]